MPAIKGPPTSKLHLPGFLSFKLFIHYNLPKIDFIM